MPSLFSTFITFFSGSVLVHSQSVQKNTLTTIFPHSIPPSGYSLYYTDAGNCDPTATNPQEGCSYPILNMWLQQAKFTPSGKLETIVNVTEPYYGMGYLSTNPTNTLGLFVSQDEISGNTYSYQVDLVNPKNAPFIVLDNLTALLEPCKPTCVESSTFHNLFTPDGKAIVFAFRNWDQYGNGIGSQGLAIADNDGSNVRILTYNLTGPQGGLMVIDTCPIMTLNNPDKVFFIRSSDAGANSFAAIVDIHTLENEVLMNLPSYAPSSGCPNFIPDNKTNINIMYMGCLNATDCEFGSTENRDYTVSRTDNLAARWGMVGHRTNKNLAFSYPFTPSSLRKVVSPYNYFQVSLSTTVDPMQWSANLMFNAPLTDAPGVIDCYGITQCDTIHGLPTSSNITCEGSDPKHSFFQRLFVNSSTGNGTVISYDTFRVCMTPRCSMLVANFATE